MKISFNWILDHINTEPNAIDIKQLVDLFIKKTAEIESYHHIQSLADQLELVSIQKILPNNMVTAYSPEKKNSL